MFDKQILNMTPTYFHCPICGEMHSWLGKRLGEYDINNQYVQDCFLGYRGGRYSFFQHDDKLYVSCGDVNDFCKAVPGALASHAIEFTSCTANGNPFIEFLLRATFFSCKLGQKCGKCMRERRCNIKKNIRRDLEHKKRYVSDFCIRLEFDTKEAKKLVQNFQRPFRAFERYNSTRGKAEV